MSQQPSPSAAVSVEGGVITVSIESTIAAPSAEVWALVSTFAGVNAELMPLCRMREPTALRGRTLESYRPGERAACWLLAGGVLPFDRHLLGLASITPGVGFDEESTSWLQRRWRHQRTLSAAGTATTVRDHLTVEPRVRLAARLTGPIIARIFEHRHRRLRARFAA